MSSFIIIFCLFLYFFVTFCCFFFSVFFVFFWVKWRESNIFYIFKCLYGYFAFCYGYVIIIRVSKGIFVGKIDNGLIFWPWKKWSKIENFWGQKNCKPKKNNYNKISKMYFRNIFIWSFKKFNWSAFYEILAKFSTSWPEFLYLSKISIVDKKVRFLPTNSTFEQKFDFWPKISIFDQNFRFLTKISMFDQNFDFCTKFSMFDKSLIFHQKIYFWSKFRLLYKISIFDQIFYFWAKFRILAIQIFLKLWHKTFLGHAFIL